MILVLTLPSAQANPHNSKQNPEDRTVCRNQWLMLILYELNSDLKLYNYTIIFIIYLELGHKKYTLQSIPFGAKSNMCMVEREFRRIWKFIYAQATDKDLHITGKPFQILPTFLSTSLRLCGQEGAHQVLGNIQTFFQGRVTGYFEGVEGGEAQKPKCLILSSLWHKKESVPLLPSSRAIFALWV